ncbi:hypothetical protein LINPERHAP1_LOCUS15886 [Linum perenne]
MGWYATLVEWSLKTFNTIHAHEKGRKTSVMLINFTYPLMRKLPSFPVDEEVEMMTSSSWSRP